ncbi:MAG: MaoC family dehydratase [Alphaproteobacteria bacterium]
MTKSATGRFFEDFRLGEEIRHATPRTVTAGDVALYQALYGSRFALQSSDEFAKRMGNPAAPLDDWLVFHIVFGKSVPDISFNAVANLGYAEGRFLAPVYPGDTLGAASQIIGLKETSSRKAGIVYVRTIGRNQRDEEVLSYARWVMVAKRSEASPAPEPVVPKLAAKLEARALALPVEGFAEFDFAASGGRYRFGDYAVGERIDHGAGTTIEEAEHQLATRLYQNTARVHFDGRAQGETKFGRRLVYGGHIISIARALSFNGLENAVRVIALNGGQHVAPSFAGDTAYAWSEVLETAEAPGRPDLGLLRLRTIGLKNRTAMGFPVQSLDGSYDPAVILDLDTWIALPR